MAKASVDGERSRHLGVCAVIVECCERRASFESGRHGLWCRCRRRENVPVLCRIDTLDEIEYFRNGGILHYVLRGLASAA